MTPRTENMEKAFRKSGEEHLKYSIKKKIPSISKRKHSGDGGCRTREVHEVI
jgi:hypothetical protein